MQKARGLGLPDHFYNYLELADNGDEDDKFPWEEENEKSATPTPTPPPPTAQVKPSGIPKPIFGSGGSSSGGAFNFGAKSTTTGSSSGGGGFGGFGGAAGGGFKFSMGANDAFKNQGKSLFSTNTDNGGDETVNDECTAEFKPVLAELPPVVEVTTGIENDEEVFSHRGKLYRYARECNPAEWKERGLGDIKILKTPNQVCV